jgi:hypothetical protein
MPFGSQCFCESVCNHFLRWAILQASPSIFDTVSDEMILDIDIFCSCMVLRAVGKCNGALVVAVDDVLIADIVANLFEES